MDECLHVPFRPEPLVVQGVCNINNVKYDNAVPSYVFPSCMPHNFYEHRKGKQFCISPTSNYTISNMYHSIHLKFKLKVFYVINLRMQQSKHQKNEVWLPLQGGPTAAIKPSKINHVLNEILKRCPSTFILHCTHGINRTLLILAALYLVHNPSKTIDAALHHVKQIRPPGILRSNVIDSLKAWYVDRKKIIKNKKEACQ